MQSRLTPTLLDLAVAVVSGMADVFGFGTHLSPAIPYYGPWQAFGVLFGEAVIILGFIFQIPFTFHRAGAEANPEKQDQSEPGNVNIVFE